MLRVGWDNGMNGAVVAIDDRYQVVYQSAMPVTEIGVRRKTRSWDERARKASLEGKPIPAKTTKGKKRVIDEHGVAEIFAHLMTIDRDLFVVVEQAAPGRNDSVGSAFAYGDAFGAVRGVLAALGVAYEVVGPKVWQNVLLKGMLGDDTKAKSVQRSRTSLPTLDLTPGRKRKPDEGLADAGCMALYAAHLRPPAKPEGTGTRIMPPPPR